MSAIVHAAADPLPSAVAIDSSFLAGVINPLDSHHEIAWILYERIAGGESAVVVCPLLLKIELNSVFRRWARQLRRPQLERLVERSQQELRGGQTTLFPPRAAPGDAIAKRRFLFDYGHALVEHVLDHVTVVRVRLTHALVDASADEVVSWALDSHDALICALARETGRRLRISPSVVSFDGDFRSVDGLHVWAR